MAVIKNEDNTVTLTGADVFSKIKINAKENSYKGSREGEIYYIGTYNGVSFIAEKDVRDYWVKGDIAELTLKSKQYGRWMKPTADPMNPVKPGTEDELDNEETQLVTREAYDVIGILTHTQMRTMKLAEAGVEIAVDEMKLEFDIKKAKAMSELKLDDAKIEALKTAV